VRFEALEALSVKVLTHLRGNSFSLLEIYQRSKKPAFPERRYKLVQHKKSRHGNGIVQVTILYQHNKMTAKSFRNNQQDVTMYENLLFQRFLLLNMFRATHRSSSEAQKLYL